MDLILTHAGADFDAMASIIAARKLYPGSRIAFLGTHEENIKQFLRDFGDTLKITGSRGINLDEVNRLIMVETSSFSRLGPFKNLARNRKLEIHIYDHHPPEKSVIAQKFIYRHVGATTTILTDIIRRKGIELTSLEATLFVLGIYEDTGSLSFPSTTPRDRKAAQFLISMGANLGLVTRYLTFSLTHDQVAILKELVHSLETHYFDGLKVYIAKAASSRYVGDIAVLAHSLREMENLDAIFILVRMGERIQLVARSQTDALDVGEVARLLGGGGHATAASASIKKNDLEKTRLKLISSIRARIKIIKPKIKTRAVQPEKEKNIVSLMKMRLPSELLKLFLHVGFLGDQLHMGVFLVGGFVRDLLLGVKDLDIDVVVEGDGLRFAKKLSQSLKGHLHIHQKFKTAVVSVSTHLTHPGLKSGSRSGLILSGAEASIYKIDIATARIEYYERPGALPTVIPHSSIREDLSRRDFTINALAIQLNRRHFGRLVDYYGGEKDLRRGVVRVLHNFSFIEDPTRIFRAVRFTERYNFDISPETEDLIKRAVKLELFESLTPERVRQELVAILSEENPIKAIKRMAEFNELAYIHPSIKYDRNLHMLLTRIGSEIRSHRLHFPQDSLTLWSIYFMAITSSLTQNELEEVLQKFTFSKKEKTKLCRSRRIVSRLRKALEKSSIPQCRLYCLLNPLSLEEIIFLRANTVSRCARKNIHLYLKKLRYVKVEVTGKDLIRFGLKPGPVFSMLLKKLLLAKLNGRVKTKKDEEEYAKKSKFKFP